MGFTLFEELKKQYNAVTERKEAPGFFEQGVNNADVNTAVAYVQGGLEGVASSLKQIMKNHVEGNPSNSANYAALVKVVECNNEISDIYSSNKINNTDVTSDNTIKGP